MLKIKLYASKFLGSAPVPTVEWKYASLECNTVCTFVCCCESTICSFKKMRVIAQNVFLNAGMLQLFENWNW